MQRYAELLLRIATQVLLDESRREAVKAGGHRRVGGEEISGSSDGECNVERLRTLLHETAGAFQCGKGRMPLVQMTDLRLDAEHPEQPPSTDAKQQLLRQAQLRTAAIQLAGDASMCGVIRCIIAIEQVKLHPTDLDLPGAQPDRVTRQGDFQPQPLTIGLA